MEEHRSSVFLKKTYYTVGQALELLVLLVLVMFIWSFLIGLIFRFMGIDVGNNTLSYLFFNILLPIFAYGTVFIYIYRVKGVSLKQIIDKKKIKFFTYVKVFFLFLGYLFLLSVLNSIIQMVLPINEDTLEIFTKFLGGHLLLVLLAVCVVAPIAEETIFRGLLLKGFLEKMNRWPAILLNALLFGILHLNIWQGISAFFLGILLCWLYAEIGSLKLVIFAHAANNFIAVSMARLGSNLDINETVEVTVSVSDYIVVAALGLLIFLLSIISIKKDKYYESTKGFQEVEVLENLEKEDIEVKIDSLVQKRRTTSNLKRNGIDNGKQGNGDNNGDSI